jgi:Domain of unknown function (DUF4483)
MLESQHNFYNMLQKSGNFLLIRGDVGKKKPDVYDLPSRDFAFGKNTKEDNEGAGDLIKNWKFHENSPKPQNETDFRLMNSISAANGLTTATEFKKFRKQKEFRTHTQMPKSKRNDLIPGTTYGKPLKPATPLKAVMSNFYGRRAIEYMHDIYAPSTSSKINKWSTTKGFELFKSHRLKSLQKSESNLFKMKKFSKVQSRTNCWRLSK